MANKNFSKSTRKHIRREKSRIRSTVADVKEQDRLIRELYPPSR
jgi:hypothetical protein